MLLNGGNLLNGGKGQASKWWIEFQRPTWWSVQSRQSIRHSSSSWNGNEFSLRAKNQCEKIELCCLFPEWADDGGGSRCINYVNHRAKVVHLVLATCADDEYRKTCTHFRLWPARWWICAHNSTAQSDNLWSRMDFFFWNLNNCRVPEIE